MNKYKINPNIDLNILLNYGYEITQNNWEDLGEDCFEAIKITNIGEIVIHERTINGYYITTESSYDYLPICESDIQDLIDSELVEK